MALRRIITIDKPAENKILRARAKKVSRFDAHLQKLVDDMWETMRAAPGVGLAAPQVGESIRVLVAEYEDERVALVNPEVLKRSDETLLGTEGCLSIPGVVGDDVPRSSAVTVKGRDPKGKEIRVKAEGWFARVLQHEIDHLDGVLFIDHIPANKVREVQPDEEIEEGEVERVEPAGAKSGKNGKAAAKRPEHNERRVPAGETEKSAESATATAPVTDDAARPASPGRSDRARGAAAKSAESATAAAQNAQNAAETAAAGNTTGGGR